MKLFMYLLAAGICAAAAGCTNEKPRPETRVEAAAVPWAANIPPADKSSGVNGRSITMQHQIKGKDVYVECMITNFLIKKGTREKVEGEGHLNLYLNGKKIDEVYTAAFVIKALPPGKHTIKVELAYNDSTSYDISEEIEITIS